MPPFGAIKRRDLIKALRKAGFTGPVSGGKHSQMERGDLKVTVPNPHHQGDISRDLLAEILKQVGMSRDEWEAL
jgi:predicted RNA binding protein YcfA (HicA-like mRNA interferase family)